MFLLLLISIPLHVSNGWYYSYTLEQDTTMNESNFAVYPQDSQTLQISGKKKVTISTGSDGSLSITQELSLSIGGQIGNFGRLEGVINDNGSGGGDFVSKNLSGYDEIYLSYSFKNFSSKFGRINFGMPEMGMSTPLLGGMMSYEAAAKRPPHKLNLSLTYGEIPGKFVKKTFTSIKNTSYPLKLVSNGEYIIEGTDRVFLNALPLKRGKDYIIDYSTGVLYFLPGSKISPDDVLTVQFFVQSLPGRRNLGVARIDYSLGSIGGKLILEQTGDDIAYWRDQIGKEAFDSLRVSEDTGLVKIPAWKCVGSGNGDYDRVDSIFVFRGENKGSYTVRFSPLDGGEYEYSDTGNFYFFVGRGKGKYTPYFFTRLPSRNRMMYLTLTARKGKWEFDNLMNIHEDVPNLLNAGKVDRKLSGKWSLGFQSRLFSLDFSYFREIDSLGILLDREIKGNGYYVETKFKPSAYFRPGLFFANGDSGFVRKIWVNGGRRFFYSVMQTVADSYEVYNALLGYRTGVFNFSNRVRKYVSTSSGFLEYSSRLQYKNSVSASITRRFFDNGEMDDIFSMGIGLENLSFRYEITRVSARGLDSLFQSIYANAEGMNKGVSYSVKMAYRTDRSRQYIYRFIFVGRGNGSFSYDSTTGNFYEDPLGDYERTLVEVSGDVPIKNFDGSVSLGFGSYFLQLTANSRFKEPDRPLIYRYSAYLQGNPGRLYFTLGVGSYRWSELSGESDVNMEAELRGKFTHGVSLARKKIDDWSQVELNTYEIFEKYNRSRNLSLTLALFYRSVKWTEVATTPGLAIGVSFERPFKGFSFRGSLDVKVSRKIYDAPEILESGFTTSYFVRLSRQLGMRTVTNLELRGRYGEGHHIYNLKASISFNF